MALVLLPLAVGAWLLAAGRTFAAETARVVGATTALLTVLAAVQTSVTRPSVDRAWLPDLGLRFSLGVDGLSVPLVLLTAGVGLVVTLHTWVELPSGGSPATFVGALLLAEGGALLTFTARDAVLFVVAFEFVLLPLWLLISRFGDRHVPGERERAGLRFLLYTAVGSTLMLVGVLVLVLSAGTASFGELARLGPGLSPERQFLAAALLTVGLAVKVPLFPLHTWLPPAHTTAPTAGSVLLAAVLLKMGTYGLVRLPMATLPDGFGRLSTALALAGTVGILWGGLVCLVERDLKRLIAYSSIAHMGFVALGLATGTEAGLQAALFGNIAHGLISTLLFLVVGALKQQWGTADLTVVRPALRETAPRLGFMLMVGLAAALGLPGLAGFWGEFFAIVAAWSPAPDRYALLLRLFAVGAAVGAALAGAYAVRVARAIWVGPAVPAEAPGAATDVRGLGLALQGAVVLGIVVLGVLPGPLLAVTAPAAAAVVSWGVAP